MNLIKSLLSLIFPLECRICKKTLEAGNLTYICPECFAKIRFIEEPYCYKCNKPFGSHGTPWNRICQDCRIREHYFKRVHALGRYEGVLREAILLLKYERVKTLIPVLGELLLKYCQENLEMSNFDLLLPVPLFRSKKKEREFNQAEAFARIIGKHFSLPVSNGNLLRIRNTRGMSNLNPEERRRNVRDAFLVSKKEEIENKKILLIDDICTTAATVDECSKVLLTAGAKEITVLTLARAG